jgi:hypothetical protein
LTNTIPFHFLATMNHVKITLTITAIVAAATLATIAFAVPQQVMAGGYGHRHHNSNSIRVDQQVNQANICSTQQPKMVEKTTFAAANATTAQDPLSNPQVPQGSNTICANEGSNSADIGHH